MAEISFDGAKGLDAFLSRLGNPDTTPLLERWESILSEDNRRGVLGGIGGDGKALAPTTYRHSLASAAPASRAKAAPANRLSLSAASLGAGDNLTSSQYRKLSGPPLAPRGERSRVISNYKTRHGRTGNTSWAEGSWINVLSKKGKAFLIAHFEGQAGLPRRDLRGLRAWGHEQAGNALRGWMRETLMAQSSHFAPLGHTTSA